MMHTLIATHPGSSRRPMTAVIIGLVLFAVYFSWLSIAKADVFDTHSSDLGNMWQTMWNVAHGHGFSFTWSVLGQNVNRLSIHADYLLILLSPLTWVWPNPNSLLILQAVAVAAGAWFVYRLADHWLRRPWLAAALAGSYLFYGPLHYAVSWQFHTDTVAVTLILAAIEAVARRRRPWVFWLWFGLSLLAKEHIGLLLGPAVWLIAGRAGRRRWAFWPLLIGWAYAWLHFLVIIPAARPGNSPNLALDFYYPKLGSTTGQRLFNLIQPSELWRRVTNPVLGTSAVFLLVPLGLLPLLSSFVWLAGAAVLPHWLSDDWSNQTVYYHNHVLAIPFLIVAAILGLRWWLRHLPRRWPAAWIGVWLALWTTVGSLTVGPLPWSRMYNPNVWQRNPYLAAIPAMKRRLPQNASVSYSKQAGAWFRDRFVAQELPNGVAEVEYIVLVDGPTNSGDLLFLRRRYEFYRTYLRQSHAFRPIYDDGHNFIYARRRGIPLEPIPPEFGPPSAIGKFQTS